MADEQQEIRRIDWNEVFTVTHVFRSFQMARHFSKLALALAAVLLIGLWGLALDVVSGWSGAYVANDEIHAHTSMSEAGFAAWQEKIEAERPAAVGALYQKALNLGKGGGKRFENPFRGYLEAQGGLGGHFETALFNKLDSNEPKVEQIGADKDWAAALDRVETILGTGIDTIDGLLAPARKQADEDVEADANLKGEEKKGAKDEAAAAVEEHYHAAQRALTRMKIDLRRRQVCDIRGRKVFSSFIDYEGQCLTNALLAIRRANLAGGLAAYRKMLDDRAAILARPKPVQLPKATSGGGLTWTSPTPVDDPPGFLFWVLMGVHGVGWLFCQHWLFAVAFLAVALGIWALFGGAIHRICALHFARDEKISVAQAMKFAMSKFFSFYTAPLIPLAIILLAGLFMIVGGALMSIPYVGIVMSLLFPLALIGGLVIAFLMFGLVAGGGLMYPTIAVESSDSFDAISRSYSYVFGKPWRAAFHAIVALVYGVICYLVVRLFVYVALAATHCFVGAGIWRGGETISSSADKLDVLWAAPTYNNLLSTPRWEAMSGSEAVAAFIIWLWVIPIAGLVLAFLLSYCCSASTTIYYLLRRKVDATDLDDVYVEEPEDEPLLAEPGEEEPSPAADEEPAAAEPKAPKPKRARKKAAKKKAKKADKPDEKE